MRNITKFLGNLLKRGGSYLRTLWASATVVFKSTKAKAVGGWIWRAFDVTFLGIMAWDWFHDDENPESLIKINNVVIETILNPVVMTAIHNDTADDDAVINLLNRNGAVLASDGGMRGLYGLSLTMAAMYKGSTGSSEYYLSFEKMGIVLSDVADAVEKLYADMFKKANEDDAEKAADMIKSLLGKIDEKDLDPTHSKNLDYLAYFFQTLQQDCELAPYDKTMKINNSGPILS